MAEMIQEALAGRKPAVADTSTYRPSVPIALMLLALIVWLGFQTVQLWSERSSLRAASASQAVQIEQSQKLRTALDAFAADTARLAAAGNANAQLLVDELKKRGVTINPAKQAQPAGAIPGTR